MRSQSTRRHRRVAECIAAAFRDGVWHPPAMANRAAHDLGVDRAPWLLLLAESTTTDFSTSPDHAPRRLASFIARELIDVVGSAINDPVLDWIGGVAGSGWRGPVQHSSVPIRMAAQQGPVPTLDDVRSLAQFLAMDDGELAWYADVRSMERSVESENLRHYNYGWKSKRAGGARLLEAPKQNLKETQRKILRNILDPLPTHDAAHGFCQGRSIHSYAGPHTGQQVVIRLDLRRFFPSVSAGRIFAVFHNAGFAEDVSHLLTGLTTNAAPNAILRQRPAGTDRTADAWLRAPHLPQGSPTSPALANLAAFGLDRRLRALAESFSVRYTRYADDLAFSGGSSFERHALSFVKIVSAIIEDEAFVVAVEKTQVRTASQRQVLTGLVVNEHLNVHRRDYDQLKAILHEAIVSGPEQANRSDHQQFRSHLEGRIGFVHATNPHRATKLWKKFDQITWPR